MTLQVFSGGKWQEIKRFARTERDEAMAAAHYLRSVTGGRYRMCAVSIIIEDLH